jgi:type I restriction enzyme S subunit
LKTGEIKNNVILKSEEWISELGLKNSSAKLLPKDTVLMSMYGANSGEVGYLKFLATTNQACCGIVCESKYDAAFLFYNLLINQDYHHSQATGGAQQNLSKEYIANISILIPQEDLVRKSNLFQVIDYCTALKAEFQKLSKLKDFLLSKMTKVESKNKMEVV